MAVSKQVADAYKNHFGTDVIGDTVESPILPSGSAEAIISPSKIGAEALQSTKKTVDTPIAPITPIKKDSFKTPSFSDITKNAYAASGSAEYIPSQGIGLDYTKKSKLMTDKQLQDAINVKSFSEGTPSATGGSQEYKALTAENMLRNQERQKILDQSDMLERKLNFQARQKELGVSALDEAASYVGTSKFTDATGVNYLNPLFYAAKAADIVVTAHKAVAQGAISAVGTLGASIDLNAGDNIVGDFGEAVSDYAKIIKQKYPQLNPSKNIGSWEDPEFYAKGVAEMLPNLLGGVAASIVGAAVGGAATVNPAGAVVGGITGALSFGYAMESGNIYDDLVTRGYSPSSADGWSKAYGAIAALPEAFFHIRGVGSAVMHPVMEEVMKKGLQAELKQTLFTSAKKLTVEGLKKGKGAVIEGSTEALQQLAQNTITKFYDKNQSLFDGLTESFVFGMGSGALVEAGQNIGTKDINKEAVVALQNEKAIEQAVKATELLQKTYPKDKDIAGLLLKTKTELQNAQIQTKIIDSKFVQANTTPIVQNEVLDATVSKNIHGKFIATFDTTLGDKSVTFTSQQLQNNEQDATLEVAKTTQAWLEKQVDSGTVTDIEQATKLNNSLKEIISPKVETIQKESVIKTTISDNAISTEIDNIIKNEGIPKEAKELMKNTNYVETDENGGFIRFKNDGEKIYDKILRDKAIQNLSKTTTTQDPLIEEAKKYKTVEEFIKSKENSLNNFAIRKNSPQEVAYGLARKMNTFSLGDIKLTKLQKEELQQWDNKNSNQISSVGLTSVKDVPVWVKNAWDQSQSKNLPSKQQLTDIYNKAHSESIKTEPKASEKTTPKKEEGKNGKKKKVTRFAERMKEQFKELSSPQEYKDYNMNEEIDKAASLIEKDEKKAYSIAMGYTDARTEEMSFTNMALAKKALDEGNIDLANTLITHLSNAGTQAGQLIVSLKALSQGYSVEKYMMDVLKTRTVLANKKLGSFKDVFKNIKEAISGKTETKVKKEVRERTKKAELTIEEKRKISLEKAKKFISDLQCK